MGTLKVCFKKNDHLHISPYTLLSICNPTEVWILAFLVALTAFPLAAFAKGSSLSAALLQIQADSGT